MDTQNMDTNARASVYSLDHVCDDELHLSTRRLVGRSNQLLAALLAHLGEVEARGIHRERCCASLVAYCAYELRLSEDAAFRRARAARLAREFPIVLEQIAAGELHLTGLLLLGPHLTEHNHRELLALARHRTKRDILRLIRRIDPKPDATASVEPLGPTPVGVPLPKPNPSWQDFIQALCPPVQQLAPGDSPREWITEVAPDDDSDLGVQKPAGAPPEANGASGIASAEPREQSALEATRASAEPGEQRALAQSRANGASAELTPLNAPERYKVQFTASQEYVDLLQQAKDLMSHALPSGALDQVHLQAMRLLVAELKKRRAARLNRPPGATKKHPRQRDDSRAPLQRDNADAPPHDPRLDAASQWRQRGDSRAASQWRQRDETEAPARPDPRPDAPREQHQRGDSRAPLQRDDADVPAERDPAADLPRRRRHVVAAVRRTVWSRDGSQCTFVDLRGIRCRETAFLELHHLDPHARGGPDSIAS